MERSDAPKPIEVPFVFSGDAGAYFRIWIVNVVLSVLTLGIYSAWAKKRTRQYFYRHTSIDGTAFEYLADPLQILKGRIIVALMLGALFGLQAVAPVLYLVGLLVLVAATPALSVAAMRFNARNSAWRNVRFGFDGGVKDAYLVYANMVGLYVLTCGLATPYAQWLWFGFIANNHRFGRWQARWHTKANEVITLYIYMVPMFVALYVLLFGGIMGVGAAAAIFTDEDADPEAVDTWISIATLVVMPVFYALFTIPTAFFKARMANLFYGGLEIGEHGLRSEQRFGELLKIYLGNLVALALTLGLAWPWAKVRLAAYRASRLTLLARGPLVVEAGEGDASAGAIGDAAVDFGELDLDLGF